MYEAKLSLKQVVKIKILDTSGRVTNIELDEG
jgi:hypothetical protein